MVNPNLSGLNEILQMLGDQGSYAGAMPPPQPSANDTLAGMQFTPPDFKLPSITTPAIDPLQPLHEQVAKSRAAEMEAPPEPDRVTYGSKDLPALGALLIGLLSGKNGGDFATGLATAYHAGKTGAVKEANERKGYEYQTRLMQQRRQTQNAEQDLASAIAEKHFGEQMDAQKLLRADNQQARKDVLDRQTANDASNAEEKKATVFKGLINDLAVPTKPEQVDGYFRALRGFLGEFGKIKGYEGVLNMLPPEGSEQKMKDALVQEAKDKAAQKAADESKKSLSEYLHLAVQSTDHSSRSLFFGQAASTLPPGSALRKLYEGEAKSDDPTRQERGESTARTEKMTDRELKAIDEDMDRIDVRAKAGTATPEDMAAWDRLAARRNAILGGGFAPVGTGGAGSPGVQPDPNSPASRFGTIHGALNAPTNAVPPAVLAKKKSYEGKIEELDVKIKGLRAQQGALKSKAPVAPIRPTGDEDDWTSQQADDYKKATKIYDSEAASYKSKQQAWEGQVQAAAAERDQWKVKVKELAPKQKIDPLSLVPGGNALKRVKAQHPVVARSLPSTSGVDVGAERRRAVEAVRAFKDPRSQAAVKKAFEAKTGVKW